MRVSSDCSTEQAMPISGRSGGASGARPEKEWAVVSTDSYPGHNSPVCRALSYKKHRGTSLASTSSINKQNGTNRKCVSRPEGKQIKYVFAKVLSLPLSTRLMCAE